MRTFTRTGAAPPSRSISLSCKAAQQLRLQADIHLADFVEQQRPAIRRLEFADTACDGAGERTLLVAEQLGLQQVVRDRRTVQRDERARRAARATMDVARQHLLAGARFTHDQHRGIGGRDLFGAAHGFLHGGVAHDHRVGLAGGGFQDGGDQIGIGRQRQELARALANGACCRLRVVAGAAGDNRHRDAFGGERAHHRAHVVRQIAQHEVDASVRAQARQAGIGVIRLVELRAARDRDPRGLAEFASQRADDQNAHRRCLTSSGRS